MAEIKDVMSRFIKRRIEVEFRIMMLNKKNEDLEEEIDAIHITEVDMRQIRVNTLK